MALILDLLAKLRPVLARFWPHILSAALALAAWHFWTRAVANAEAVRTQAAQFMQAQADAAKIAQEALHHQEAEYQAKATETQNAYEVQLADAHAAADRYIAAHRLAALPPGLRTQAAQGDASATAPSTQSGGAPLPSGVPADPVVVSADDVQACTGAVSYALKAHDWAGELGR
ncbi:hypothetical protein Y88_0449 [Novosphingobium nitrogenifigens DSM 19370]|uniref:Uncharacterized protein n=1 Tax=Novosphingobium nitrogenifigens DSM 19370 TaxID=983920 RepID=F1Z9B1_9SPHN|nr:hypothetical protein [Novosphingobium nitrogenifigens]EGD58394.1 hypothetical protein Y88_0449 [Novosphingobium nitrogenifigens DSM 19370]